jgi:SAM-dependent methyltransferase
MPGSYADLAPIYDVAGLSAFSKNITPQLLRFLLQRDWLGRSILDLGCGTGASLLWLKQQGYNVVGVDTSPEMIQAAQQTFRENGVNIPLHQHDVRQLQFNEEYDLVLALNVLNELDNVRDLEATFKSVHRALKPGQFFAFDLLTIEGLAQGANTERLFYDSPETLTVFTRIGYDYERQLRTVRYWLFQREANGWQRYQTELHLRGYPVQAAVGLFQRSGFDVLNVLTGGFAPYEVGTSGIERVIVVGKKV